MQMYPGQQVTAPASPGLEVNRKLPQREALPLAGDRGVRKAAGEQAGRGCRRCSAGDTFPWLPKNKGKR